MESLTQLELGGNQIEFVDERAFLKLEFLEFLGLGENRLETVPTLFGLDSLKTLDLSSNNLTRLAANAFSNMPALEYLYLGRNQLSEVDELAFNGTYELGLVMLSENNLTELHPNTFARFQNIQQLDVSNNQLDEFDGVTCSDLAICYVFLKNNRLREVRNLQLSAYDNIDLFGNEIESLDDFECNVNGNYNETFIFLFFLLLFLRGKI